MRKFILTSKNYSGNAELHYNDNDLLCRIDVTDSNMSPTQVHAFKAAAPLTIQHLENGVGIPGHVTVVEADYEITFEMFWTSYNKKINKKRCEPIWKKMDKSSQIKALQGIKGYDKFLQKNDWRSKADPENYLRNAMWENEWK